jgi:hypothetical protein
MMPVPNCFRIVDITEWMVANGSLDIKIGAKTPIALVIRTTKSVPILRVTL